MAKVYFTNTAVIGVFRTKALKSGQQPRRLKLCGIDEFEHIIDDHGNKKPRSKTEKARLIDKLYNAKLREILAEEKKERQSANQVSGLMEEWLEYVRLKNSSTTEGVYRTTVDYYMEAVGDHDINAYNHKIYLKFLAYLKSLKTRSQKPMSDQRIRSHFRQLRTFYNWAFKHRYLERSFYIELPGVDKKDPVPYRQGDLVKLLEVVRNEIANATRKNHRKSRENDLRALIMVPYTGFRRGAIWSLELENIDLELGLITIRNKNVYIGENQDIIWKNKKRKEVKKPIPEILKGFLQFDLESRGPKERYYLDDGNGFTCYRSPAGITKAFQRYKQLAGIPKEVKPFHAFRTACVNGLIANNVNPTVIKDYFDHESFATSDGYSAEDLQLMKNAADQIKIGWEESLFTDFYAK